MIMAPRRFSLLLCLILFVSCLATAQGTTGSDPIAEYVRAEMQRQHIPGLSLLIARGGKVVRSEGFGLASVELQVPVKPETIFQSGSVGKQFTATAVMMLVEEGKVSLGDPLTKFFADAPATWKSVTVRELLSHTAGFGDYPKDFNFRKDWTGDELLKVVEGIPLAYSPGTKWEYSNLGYLTLGIIIHRVTGEFYGDFLQQRIFKPLNMSSTRIISEADIVPNRAAGYRLLKGELKNQEWVAPAMNYNGGRKPVFFHGRSREMGCGALYREGSEALQPRSDVDCCQTQGWKTEQRALRIRVVYRRAQRASLHPS